MKEKKTCNNCTKRKYSFRDGFIYYCIEPKKSTSLIHPTIITLIKRAGKYYEEEEKGEYVGSALAGYNNGE